MKRIVAAVALLCSTAISQQSGQPTANPQAPNPGAARQEKLRAMDKLKTLQGEWKGAGWIMLGPGQRAEFNQRETVSSKLNGLVVTIDGLGKDAKDADRTVHQAFAVISYDAEKPAYRFSTYTADGRNLDAEATVGDNTLVWGFSAPYGKIRYTITFGINEWHEVGERERPDAPGAWSKFFEMNLTK
jgi:hypothetical protein